MLLGMADNNHYGNFGLEMDTCGYITFLKELQKEFDSLEEYLKANKSTSIEKEYK